VFYCVGNLYAQNGCYTADFESGTFQNCIGQTGTLDFATGDWGHDAAENKSVKSGFIHVVK